MNWKITEDLTMTAFVEVIAQGWLDEKRLLPETLLWLQGWTDRSGWADTTRIMEHHPIYYATQNKEKGLWYLIKKIFLNPIDLNNITKISILHKNQITQTWIHFCAKVGKHKLQIKISTLAFIHQSVMLSWTLFKLWYIEMK